MSKKNTNNNATINNSKTADSKKQTAKIKATETHKLVYSALDRKNDAFVLETEATARNSKCDVTALACNRTDCSIIVKNNTTCVRRFVEIWGHTNYVDVVVKKREREALFNSNKQLSKRFAKYEYDKKQNVFKCDVKTAIAFIQLLIDTSVTLDSKTAEAEQKQTAEAEQTAEA